MEKLTFYAIQAPEKLDRIGEHLFQKTNNYLYRKRIDYVYISIEAMDSLLMSSSSSLNYFVESFLKMVTLLLESSETGLQIRATNSFVKFANIDEDTPSYHRRYEFFISRFSQLCYTAERDNPEMEKQIRLSGLQGLQGVVRKTVNDDLQANIWDDMHMTRIVPALLFNIECNSEVKIWKMRLSINRPKVFRIESIDHKWVVVILMDILKGCQCTIDGPCPLFWSTPLLPLWHSCRIPLLAVLLF